MTDAVLEDLRAWESRPLDAVYPIGYLAEIHLKLRSSGAVDFVILQVPPGISRIGNTLRA